MRKVERLLRRRDNNTVPPPVIKKNRKRIARRNRKFAAPKNKLKTRTELVTKPGSKFHKNSKQYWSLGIQTIKRYIKN